MATRGITATALSRNFADILNHVRYQGLPLEVTRGNEAVACVTPPGPFAGYPIDQLDRLLTTIPRLSESDAKQVLRDIHEGIGKLITESNAWGS